MAPLDTDKNPVGEHVTHLSSCEPHHFPQAWYCLNSPDHFWFQWRWRIMRTLCRTQQIPLSAPLRALDIGCGTNVVRGQVESQSQWTVDGADLCLDALQMGAPGRGETYFYDIYERHAAFAQQYDVIFLLDVLEHIEDTKGFLEAARWHLKPDGRMLINVPALPSLYSVYDSCAGHVQRYSYAQLHTHLQEAGLNPMCTRYWGLSMVPILWIRKWMLGQKQDPGEIFRIGFRVPGRFMHTILKACMYAESFVLRRPPSGSSLLCCASALP